MVADYGGVSGPDWYEGAAARIVGQVDGSRWIAVLHSGAGGFAPALAAVAANLAGLIFVDAVLPYPGRSWRQTAPDLAQRLTALAADGVLPGWNRWSETDPTPRLLPVPAQRDAFIHALPRVPLAYLDAVSPASSQRALLPAAYLQLSPGYAAEAVEAERRGWPVRRTRLHHLAMVSHPAKVAALLLDLAMELRTA